MIPTLENNKQYLQNLSIKEKLNRNAAHAAYLFYRKLEAIS